MNAPERYGPERIVAFSDAVVAIAITILLLPLAELEMPADDSVIELFKEHAQLFGGLTLSWVIIAIFWLGHHRMFDHISFMDRMLVRLNFLWLFIIALMPVPTNIIVSSEDVSSAVVALYVGWMALTSFLMLCMWMHARRTPGMMPDEYRDSSDAREAEIRQFLILGVFLLALVLAVPFKGNALYVLFLQIPVDWVAARIVRRRSVSA